IGEKAAAGNSTQVLNYTIDDLSPLQGSNYYRLKIIDEDGSFSYSQTIMINVSTVIEYKDIITKIFPNPTNHILYIDYQSATNSIITLKVFDAIGQEISNSKMTVVRGNQLLKVDASAFAEGVYIINIQDANSGKILQAKFVKD
ncbi:MAG TPA: T9SS type A sorting domain-containing protein, partial [Chitinophagales bacterium]|nr:T9SS type A sorting domain-containing protein [Chitinophagales bacterium]